MLPFIKLFRNRTTFTIGTTYGHKNCDLTSCMFSKRSLGVVEEEEVENKIMLIIVGRPLPIIISSFTSNLTFVRTFFRFVAFLVLVSAHKILRPFLFNFNYVPGQNGLRKRPCRRFGNKIVSWRRLVRLICLRKLTWLLFMHLCSLRIIFATFNELGHLTFGS